MADRADIESSSRVETFGTFETAREVALERGVLVGEVTWMTREPRSRYYVFLESPGSTKDPEADEALDELDEYLEGEQKAIQELRSQDHQRPHAARVSISAAIRFAERLMVTAVGVARQVVR